VRDRNLTLIGAHLTTVADREASAARWTFQQEASVFLDFIARRRLRVDDLVTRHARPGDCNAVYEQLASGSSKHTAIVFEWRPEPAMPTIAAVPPSPARARASAQIASSLITPLKIGIVGLGSIGQEHARQAVRASGVAVTALFDTNQTVSNQLAASLSATSYASYDALLDS